MKLCLFGGTFDPIHIGHLIMAQSVINDEELDIEKVVFIPAADPPHKEIDKYSSYDHRCNMISKAVKNRQIFEVSQVEHSFEGLSFTIKTVKYFSNKYELSKNDLYLLIGEDSLVNFHTWRQPEEILENARLLTINRPGWNKKTVEDKYLKNTKFIDSPAVKLSSSLIRTYIQKGKSIQYLVTETVRKYIYKHNLYRK